MTYVPRTGIGGTATINGTELPVTSWNVSPQATIQEYKNSLSGGHPVRAATFDDGGAFTIVFDWQDSSNPFGAPLSLRVGQSVTAVKLYLDGNAGSLYWSFPVAIVRSLPQSITVDGKIMTSLALVASGTYGAPGGSVA